MVAGGLPYVNTDNALHICSLALDMMDLFNGKQVMDEVIQVKLISFFFLFLYLQGLQAYKFITVKLYYLLKNGKKKSFFLFD